MELRSVVELPRGNESISVDMTLDIDICYD